MRIFAGSLGEAYSRAFVRRLKTRVLADFTYAVLLHALFKHLTPKVHLLIATLSVQRATTVNNEFT